MTSALIAGVLKILHLAVSDSSAPRVNLGSEISALDGKVVELLSLDVKVPMDGGL